MCAVNLMCLNLQVVFFFPHLQIFWFTQSYQSYCSYISYRVCLARPYGSSIPFNCSQSPRQFSVSSCPQAQEVHLREDFWSLAVLFTNATGLDLCRQSFLLVCCLLDDLP